MLSYLGPYWGESQALNNITLCSLEQYNLLSISRINRKRGRNRSCSEALRGPGRNPGSTLDIFSWKTLVKTSPWAMVKLFFQSSQTPTNQTGDNIYPNNEEAKLSLHLSVAFSVTKLFSQKIKIKHLIFSATWEWPRQERPQDKYLEWL